MVERPLLSRTRGLRLVHRMYNQVMPDCARGKKRKRKEKGTQPREPQESVHATGNMD